MKKLHSWTLSPEKAVRIQQDLRRQIKVQPLKKQPRYIAGLDVAMEKEGRWGFGGVIVYTYPELQEVERRWAKLPVQFPYVPGLLAFREAAILLEALRKIQSKPDVLLFDGQGIAHPRRMGIASHLGLLLDTPSIGCAKSKLTGTYKEPGPKFGDTSALLEGEETIGAALRTKPRTKPIFVSIGHRITLEETLRIVQNCCDGFRIPKPTRQADQLVAQVKKLK